MQIKVNYVVRKEVEMELPEELFRELYNKFKDSYFARSMIADEIYFYLEQESECLETDGQKIEFDVNSIDNWVWDMFEKISKEE